MDTVQLKYTIFSSEEKHLDCKEIKKPDGLKKKISDFILLIQICFLS